MSQEKEYRDRVFGKYLYLSYAGLHFVNRKSGKAQNFFCCWLAQTKSFEHMYNKGSKYTYFFLFCFPGCLRYRHCKWSAIEHGRFNLTFALPVRYRYNLPYWKLFHPQFYRPYRKTVRLTCYKMFSTKVQKWVDKKTDPDPNPSFEINADPDWQPWAVLDHQLYSQAQNSMAKILSIREILTRISIAGQISMTTCTVVR